jgi:predicted metalloprotease with PDZ domain
VAAFPITFERLTRRVSRVVAMIVAGLVAGGCATSAGAGDGVEYTVSLDAARTQMVDVAMRVPDVRGPELDVVLPSWRPGRYVISDPAGGVRGVEATDADGAPLDVRKVDKSTWRVTTGGAGEVVVRYRVYANDLGGRTRHADDSHAFLSGESVFMHVPERRGDGVRVRVEAPDGWWIATGLEPVPGRPDVVTAPSYDVLMDSPLEIGLHDRHVFEVDGRPHEIVVWPTGIDYDATRLQEDFARIVETQTAIFGRMPYERYVFLMHVGAGAGGGTEHLNSTIMQTSRSALEGSRDESRSYQRLLGLVAHEFFHTWNVKQLRPAGIHPYDYARENYTDLLWVAEGTTDYYDGLTLVRAGLVKPRRYLDRLAGSFASLRDRPGARVQSVSESSFDAWIKFNRRTPDGVNSTVSFYSKGALVSLLLDLEIRRHTGGRRGLDEVMRLMFERFPLSGPGYTQADIVAVVEEVSGTGFGDFFARYVDSTDPLPLSEAFEVVGLELRFEPREEGEDEDADDADDGDDGDDADADEDGDEGDGSADDDPAPEPPRDPPLRAYLGLDLSDGGGRTTVRVARADGPAYEAGVIAGDQIVAMDGRRLRASDKKGRLAAREPGDTVRLTIFRRDELRTIDVVLAGRPDGTWKLTRTKEPTAAQEAAYASWLGQAW